MSESAVTAPSRSSPIEVRVGKDSALTSARGVDVRGVDHGEETRGGSGSKVKMEAMMDGYERRKKSDTTLMNTKRMECLVFMSHRLVIWVRGINAVIKIGCLCARGGCETIE
jgi:hypothetical protein